MRFYIVLWSLRAAMLLALPVIVPFAFFATLVREIDNAFHYAYLSAAEEVESFPRLWRKASLDAQPAEKEERE